MYKLLVWLALSAAAFGQVAGSPGVTGGNSSSGSVTGGTCTNQVATAISVAGVPTCTTVTSAYVDASVAATANYQTTGTAQAQYSGHGACTNQVVTSANANAAPTCSTVSTAMIGTLVAGSNGLANSATTDTTCAAGQVWNGTACTATPTLGASGTVGTIALGNNSSGVLTLQAATGVALGQTATLPNNTGTIAETNMSQTYSGINQFTGNRKFVTADFTSANSASLQAITGLSWTLASGANASFHCVLMYSQATNVAGDQFGVGDITTAPSNLSAFGTAFTNTGAASPVSTGILTALASTTPTAVVTFQPAVTTVLGATLDGTVEAGAGANTFNIYVLNGTAADVIVVKRGSYCDLM